MEDTIVISIILGILGLVSGSFAGAQVWRLRAAQLRSDAENDEDVSAPDKHEVAKLQKKKIQNDRSVCLHCGHTLEWYDLIPIISWASLKGKCRYCHKSIGTFEPIMELGVAAFFVISFLFWPHPLISGIDIAQFVLWLVAGIGLAILSAYDAKWFLLPNVIVFPLIGLGAIHALIVVIESHFAVSVISSIISSCVFLSGLYYVLYIFSKHQWVGFGDVKLGLALALLLADWQLAVLALFLANLVGTLVVLPSLLFGKITRQTHIPFGPLLIIGWAIAGLFGTNILYWYMNVTLGA